MVDVPFPFGDNDGAAFDDIDAFAPDRFDGDETFEITEGMSVERRSGE